MRKLFSIAAASVIVLSLASCTADEPEKKKAENCEPLPATVTPPVYPEGCEPADGSSGSTMAEGVEDVEEQLTGETVPMSMEGDGTTPFTDEENSSDRLYSVSKIAENEEYAPSENPDEVSGALKTVPVELENLFKNLDRNGFDSTEDYLPTETAVENYVPMGTQYAANGPFEVLSATRPVVLSGEGDPNAPIEELKKVVGSHEALTVTVCDADDNKYTALMSTKWEKLRGVWKVSNLTPAMFKCEGNKAARDFTVKQDPLLTGEAQEENFSIQKEALKFAISVENTNKDAGPAGKPPVTVEKPAETTKKQ